MIRRFPLPALILAVALCAAPAAAAADPDPSNRDLVLAGLAMTPPTYFVGVIAHEGSHALGARMVGARVVEFHVLPGWRGTPARFQFGFVRVMGLDTTAKKSFFWLAPKITDAVMLGGYSLAVATDTLPDNRYGRLALAVLATGFWIDFAKDVVAFRDSNDLIKTYNVNGRRTEWSRLPYRLLHAGLAAAGAYALVRGYRGVFDSRDAEGATAFAMPLWTGSF